MQQKLLFPRRITELDILRGWLLVMIIVNHLALFPGGYDFLTGRDRLWVSAAEGFFLLSGLLFGFIRGRKEIARPIIEVAQKILRRAFILYTALVGSAILLTLIAKSAGFGEVEACATAAKSWSDAVTSIVTLRHFCGFTDFLVYYSLYLLVAPVALALLRRGCWWMLLIISLLVWYYSAENILLGWQLLFFGGAVTGFYLPELATFWVQRSVVFRRRLECLVVILASLFLLVSAFVVYHRELSESVPSLLQLLRISPDWLQAIDQSISSQYFGKWALPLPRLIASLLVTLAAVIVLSWLKDFSQTVPARFLYQLGSASLYVYIVHAFTVYAVWTMYRGGDALINFLVVTVTLLAIWHLVRYRILFRVIPR